MTKKRIKAPPRGFLKFVAFSTLFTVYVSYILVLFLVTKADNVSSTSKDVQYDTEFDLKDIFWKVTVHSLGLISSIVFIIGLITFTNAIYVNNIIESSEPPAMSAINSVILLGISSSVMLLLIRNYDFHISDGPTSKFL